MPFLVVLLLPALLKQMLLLLFLLLPQPLLTLLQVLLLLALNSTVPKNTFNSIASQHCSCLQVYDARVQQTLAHRFLLILLYGVSAVKMETGGKSVFFCLDRKESTRISGKTQQPQENKDEHFVKI